MLAEAMDLAHLVNWEYDAVTGIFTFNDRFYAMYGTTAEREGGYLMTAERYAREFVHPDDSGMVAEEVQKALNATNPDFVSQREHRIVRRDGKIRHIVVRFGITKDEQGRTIRTHGANQDITERKKAEEALMNANRQLSLLSSITRHDILNNISINLAFLDLAKLACHEPEVQGFIGRIEKATSAIRSQIEFTRVYEDLGMQEPVWQDIETVIPGELVPATVTLDTDTKRIMVYADPMLKKVFFNLLDNSLRHGGQVTSIRISFRYAGGDLILSWEDDGIGIPADEKERIFERGFGKNSGFGMFLAREILALTGISIRETGLPGTGACFEIEVPAGSWRYPVPDNGERVIRSHRYTG